MSIIDDILQSYITQELDPIQDTTPILTPIISPAPIPPPPQIPPSLSSPPPLHDDQYEEIIQQNKIQLNRILNLEKSSQTTINQLQSEINELKSQLKTLIHQPTPQPHSYPNQPHSYPNQPHVQPTHNKVFDFIPSILQNKKHLVPTYCGRPIDDHRRFINDLCGTTGGCLRCNLDNLIKAGYSMHQLNETRKQISKLSSKPLTFT